MKIKQNIHVCLAVAALAAFTLGGCAAKPASHSIITSPIQARINRILVFGFLNATAVYGQNVNVRSPFSGKYFLTGPVEPGAAARMSQSLIQRMGARASHQLIPPGQALGVSSELMGESGTGGSQKSLILETARRLDADAVVTGYIYRFEDRAGTGFAASRPASAAFDLHLVQTSDGRVLWSGYVDETQRSLAENLFELGSFFKRRGRWITVTEMAENGLAELLDEMPAY